MPIMPFAERYNFFGNSPRLDDSRERQNQRPNPFLTPPIRQPEEDTTNPLMRKYREFIEAGAPRREDYKPRLLDRIGAGLSSIGSGTGYAGTREQLDRRFNQALEEHELQRRGLAEGAQLENQAGYEEFNRRMRERELADREKNTASLVSNRTSLEERRKSLSAIQEYKAKNPGHKFIPIAGGNIMAFDPQNPGSPIDTGISAGTLNEEDKIGLNQLNALDRIAAQGDQSRATEDVRQGGRLELEGARQENREKILQFKKDNPNYRIVPTRGGNFVGVNPSDPNDVVDTGVGTGTLSDEDKAELGLSVTTSTTTRVSETDKGGNPTAITRETTRRRGNAPAAKPTRMTDKDGNTYNTSTWSDADIEEAKRNGFK